MAHTTSQDPTHVGGERQSLISRKEIIAMDRTACSLKGVLDNVRTQIAILDAEIKAAKKDKQEFERHLGMLKVRKTDLETRVVAQKEWAAGYDLSVGPFAKRYENMTMDIGTLYNSAVKGHTAGLVMLEKEFGYHPAFKRPEDTFTGTPWRPKKC